MTSETVSTMGYAASSSQLPRNTELGLDPFGCLFDSLGIGDISFDDHRCSASEPHVFSCCV